MSNQDYDNVVVDDVGIPEFFLHGPFVVSKERDLIETLKETMQSLVENPSFCNYVFNYYSTTNQVKTYTYSCNLFFATRKYFL